MRTGQWKAKRIGPAKILQVNLNEFGVDSSKENFEESVSF
jgi:hypothetical protein